MVHFRSIVPAALVSFLLLAASCGPPVPLRIGYLAGMTGPSSGLGLEGRRALALGVADLNRTGGLLGRPVELVVLDDGNDPAQAQAAYQDFASQGIGLVLGPMTSTALATIVPFGNSRRILTVSPTASAASVAGRDDWFFRVITLNRAFGEALGAWARTRGFAEVAVLRETSNGSYTGPILEAFRAALAGSNVRIRPAVEFDLTRSPDPRALARSLGPAPAYLLLANGFDAARVGQQLALDGNLGPILCPPWAMTADVLALGGAQTERMVFVSIYDSQSASAPWVDFQKRYRELYGEEPGFAALYARDALTLLSEAVRKASSEDPGRVRDALKSLGEVRGLQGTFQLDAGGDVVRSLFRMTVRQGRFVRDAP